MKQLLSKGPAAPRGAESARPPYGGGSRRLPRRRRGPGSAHMGRAGEGGGA
nr:MAG TPA: hypothetical protein [Caudoviricetes sp.]